MTDTKRSAAEVVANKVPQITLCVLDHQDLRDDARR